MRIVDAHHHLWDLEACRYPWLMEKGVRRFFGDPAPIQKNYLATDLRHDAADFELEASVHIQVGVAPGDELLETDWLESSASAHGLPSAIVAFCDLSAGDALQQLEQQASRKHVRGIRQIIGRADSEDRLTKSGDLVDNPAWRENLRHVGELSLSFDLQLTPPQTLHVADVLADIPGVPIALCHCGSPWDQTPSGLDAWRHGLQQLAALPDVHCKLSGFGMFDHEWSVDSIRPLVESCLEIFGVERCMFGSNFPVDKLYSSYARIWNAYDDITSALEDDDRDRLFRRNARRFYRLPSTG